MIQIQYDERKNQINLRKHNITIPELATIFEDSDTIFDIPDKVHSHYELRYLAYGWTKFGNYVMVWYTYRGDTIRIIGGRKIK